MIEEVEPQTLQQQENISIKGQSARHLVMQKLMRKAEVRLLSQIKTTLFFNYKYLCSRELSFYGTWLVLRMLMKLYRRK